MEKFIKVLLTKRNKLKYLALVSFVFVCGIIYCTAGLKNLAAGQADTIKNTYTDDLQQIQTQKETDEHNTKEVCYVYVCGSVNSPGVYECSAGLRVYELIELAGGFSENADETYLNLVDSVKDGQKIYVPKVGETFEGSSQAGNKININSATAPQLMTLPGIGESRAKDIIAYRQKNGTFKDISDIKNISGIKDAAFDKIKDLICVE